MRKNILVMNHTRLAKCRQNLCGLKSGQQMFLDKMTLGEMTVGKIVFGRLVQHPNYVFIYTHQAVGPVHVCYPGFVGHMSKYFRSK